MDQLIGRQVGNYRLTKCLSQDSMVETYLGEHNRLTMTVVVKVLSIRLTEEQILLFQNIVQPLTELIHKHIARLLDFDVQDGRPFLLLDYVLSGGLRKVHPPGTRLVLRQVTGYVRQIADALHYIHSRQLVHGDVRPEKVLLGWESSLLLDDTGLVGLVRTLAPGYTYPPMEAFAYMAPEQFQSQLLPASDQYSLAVMVYEWLCGETPFQGSFTEIIAGHLTGQPPALRTKAVQVSAAIEQVVMTALAKDPTQRFASIQEFAQALEEASKSASAMTPVQATSLPLALDSHTDPLLTPPPPSETQFFASSDVPHVPTTTPQSPPTMRGRVSRRTMITALALGGAGLLVAAILNVLGNRISNQSTSSHNNTQSATASHNQPISSSASNQVVGKLIHTYQGFAGQQDPISYISWSLDSKRIATANAKSLHIWDAATGGNVTTSSHGVADPNGSLGNDHFAWIGDKLYAAIMDIKDYQNPMIRIMDLANDKEVFTYQGYATEKHPYGNPPQPMTLQWSPNGALIASLDYDTGVRVWNASNGQVISRFQVKSGDNGITDDTLLHESYLAWAADSQHLATWNINTAIVRVWDTSNGQLLCSYRKHWDQHGKDNPDHPQVYAQVYWSPDGTRIASIVPQTKPTDGIVHVWDAHSGNQICTFSALPHNVTMQLQWSADSKLIACVMDNATVQVWDASNGAPVTVRYETPGLDYIDWNPKRRFIASTMQSITNQSEFIKAHIWDATNAKEVTQLSNDVWSLAWAPDGMQIAIATLNNEIQIWQVWQ